MLIGLTLTVEDLCGDRRLGEDVDWVLLGSGMSGGRVCRARGRSGARRVMAWREVSIAARGDEICHHEYVPVTIAHGYGLRELRFKKIREEDSFIIVEIFSLICSSYRTNFVTLVRSGDSS